jgi:hypothetical protein
LRADDLSFPWRLNGEPSSLGITSLSFKFPDIWKKQGTDPNPGIDRRLSADYSEITASYLDCPGTQKQGFLLAKQGIKCRNAANNRKTVVVPRERIVVRWDWIVVIRE